MHVRILKARALFTLCLKLWKYLLGWSSRDFVALLRKNIFGIPRKLFDFQENGLATSHVLGNSLPVVVGGLRFSDELLRDLWASSWVSSYVVPYWWLQGCMWIETQVDMDYDLS